MLDSLVAFLKDHKKLVVEIGGHTDAASKSRSTRLETNRAEAVRDYLILHGIKEKRVTAKGYGESQLVNNCGCEGNVVSDCSEEEHQANRRTEFKIVK